MQRINDPIAKFRIEHLERALREVRHRLDSADPALGMAVVGFINDALSPPAQGGDGE